MMARHFRIQKFAPVLLWTMIIFCMVHGQVAATDSFQPIIPEGERIEDIEPLLGNISRGAPINSIAFSSDGKTLASGSRDNTVRIWDTASNKELKRLDGHTSTVLSVAFRPNSATIASGSLDGTVRLWDTASGKLKGFFIVGKRGTWLACLYNGSSPGPPSKKEWICRRYDDGTLLVRKGEDGGISPVLPPKPEEETRLKIISIPEDLETYDGNATDFTITLKNSGKGPLYWINVTQEVTGEKPVFHLSGTKVFQDPMSAKAPFPPHQSQS